MEITHLFLLPLRSSARSSSSHGPQSQQKRGAAVPPLAAIALLTTQMSWWACEASTRLFEDASTHRRHRFVCLEKARDEGHGTRCVLGALHRKLLFSVSFWYHHVMPLANWQCACCAAGRHPPPPCVYKDVLWGFRKPIRARRLHGKPFTHPSPPPTNTHHHTHTQAHHHHPIFVGGGGWV